MYIDFSVTNQTLSRTSNDKTVENSQNYWRCRFNFVSADWGEVTKAAMFKTPDMEKPVIRLLVDNECDFPNGTSRSTCNVALIGGGSEVITALASGTAAVRSGMIVTTNTVCIPFEDTLDSDEVDCDLSLPDNDFTEFLSKLNAKITKIDNLQEQIKADLDSKQDKLTFDDEPTADSTNSVTSGSVKKALDGKVDTLTDNGAFTVGRDANTIEGIAIGIAASTRRGVAISCAAVAEDDGIAIGEQSLTYGGIAIGHFARTFTCADNGDYIPIDAIQLGEGDNSNPYTMQVYNYQLIACEGSGNKRVNYLKDVGKLSQLTTTVKNSIVDAVNSIVTLLKNKADKQNESGGFSAGNGASASDGGAAIGLNAGTFNGGVAAGKNAYSDSGGAATGEGAYSIGGGSVGSGAKTSDGFAGGKDAKTVADDPEYGSVEIDAVQLGTGTNSNEYTAQIYDYPLIANDATTKSATDGSKYLKDVGKLSSLATSVKDNIVNAINSIVTLLSQKVDKVNGKGLSANDYTNEEKEKLSKLPTKSELNSDLEGKQDKLTFDTTPTANSTNPVTSDGVANAVENLNVQIGAQLGTVLPLKADKTELADLKLKSIPHKEVSAYPVTLTDHLADEEFIKCNVYGNADGVGNLDSADGKYKIPITLTGKNLFNFGTTQKNWYIRDNTSSVSINTNDCVVSGGYGDGASNRVLNLNKIPVTTGKKYVVSYNSNFEASRALIRLLDINGNILTTGLSTGTYNSYYNAHLINNTAASNNDRVKATFSVTNDNVYYILIGMVFMNQKDETMIQTFSKIQFELGEAATEYEDYTENTVTAVLDTALTAGEYIDIVNKKRYNGDTVTDITVNGSLKTTDSANNHISCDTAETPSKIELSYYQDVNKVLSEITNAVLAQGGDV